RAERGPAPPEVVGQVAQPLQAGGKLDVRRVEGADVHVSGVVSVVIGEVRGLYQAGTSVSPPPLNELLDAHAAVALHMGQLQGELPGRRRVADHRARARDDAPDLRQVEGELHVVPDPEL